MVALMALVTLPVAVVVVTALVAIATAAVATELAVTVLAAVMSVVSARLRNGIHPRGVEAKTTLTHVELLVVHEDRDGGKGQQVRDEHDKGKRAER